MTGGVGGSSVPAAAQITRGSKTIQLLFFSERIQTVAMKVFLATRIDASRAIIPVNDTQICNDDMRYVVYKILNITENAPKPTAPAC